MAFRRDLVTVVEPAVAYVGMWFGAGKSARMGSWGPDGAWVAEVGTGVTYLGGTPRLPWLSHYHANRVVVWVEYGGPVQPFPNPPAAGRIGWADFTASTYASQAVSSPWISALPMVVSDGVVWLEGDSNFLGAGPSRIQKAGLDLSAPGILNSISPVAAGITDFDGAVFWATASAGEGVVLWADAFSSPISDTRMELDGAGTSEATPSTSQSHVGHAYPINSVDAAIGINASGNVARWVRGTGAGDGFNERSPAFAASNVHVTSDGSEVIAYHAGTGALKRGSSTNLGNIWTAEIVLDDVPSSVDASHLAPPDFAFTIA